MNVPVTITFHNTQRTANIEEFIEEQSERLQKFNRRIQHCEVVIDQPHHHHQKGNEYQVRIVVTVPRQTIAVTSTTSKDSGHENLYSAIHDAFDSAKRKLRQQRQKPRERSVRKATKETESDGPIISASA
jgi:ribosomal subunit interface protein